MDVLNRRFLKIGLVCWALSAIVILLAATGLTLAADRAVLLALRGTTEGLPEAANALMRGITWLGDGWPRSLIAAGFVMMLMLRRMLRPASYILYVALGIAALNAWALKPLLARARPDIIDHLIVVEPSFSLPSGHAANSAAVYASIALIASVLWWRKRQRRMIWSGAWALIFLIGLSRIWLGVHWPSDVIAGWLLGGGWAFLLAALLKPVLARKTVAEG